MWQKEKLHVLCNFFFCHYVFKKPSAAEASESVYMRKRVKGEIAHNEQFLPLPTCFQKLYVGDVSKVSASGKGLKPSLRTIYIYCKLTLLCYQHVTEQLTFTISYRVSRGVVIYLCYLTLSLSDTSAADGCCKIVV